MRTIPISEPKRPAFDAAVGLPDLELRFKAADGDRYSVPHDVEILRSNGECLLGRCVSMVLIIVPGDLVRATLTLVDGDEALRPITAKVKTATQVYNVRFV